MSTVTERLDYPTTDTRPATFQYLISEDGGKTYRTVAIVDSDTREHIEAQPVTDPGFVRMFGRL